MRLFLPIVTFIIHAALALPNEPLCSVPKFEELEDRSEDGSPNVQITFPNSYTDKLILNRYYLNEEEEQAGAEHCNYVGYLEVEREACVAMTGCLGKENIEFTIMSANLPESSYKWNLNGEVEVVKNPDLPSSYLEMPRDEEEHQHPDDKGKDEAHWNPKQEEIEVEIEAFCWNGWGWGCNKTPNTPTRKNQNTHLLEYKVAYDDNFRNLGGPAQLNAVMAHVQARYCHHTLGHKFQLRKVGEKYLPGHRWTAVNSILGTLRGVTKQEVGNADTLLFLGDGLKTGKAEIGGQAWLGSICGGTKEFMAGINFWFGTATGLGEIVAHEMGHSLGMKHDSQHTGTGCEGTGIMSGVTTQWSTCSKADFLAHYANKKNQWCMPEACSACGGSGQCSSSSGSSSGSGQTNSGGGWNWPWG